MLSGNEYYLLKHKKRERNAVYHFKRFQDLGTSCYDITVDKRGYHYPSKKSIIVRHNPFKNEIQVQIV